MQEAYRWQLMQYEHVHSHLLNICLHLKAALQEGTPSSLWITEMEERIPPDPSLFSPFSPLSVFLPASLSRMARLARVTMATRTGAAWRGSTEGERRGRKGRQESTCSLLPAAETLRESRQRDKSSSPTSFIIHPYLSFTIHTALSARLLLSYLHPLLIHLTTLFLHFLLLSTIFLLLAFLPLPPPPPPLPNLLFLCSCPFLLSFSIPRHELIMTVVWAVVGTEDCNYKNVTPGYTNRHAREAITIRDICALSSAEMGSLKCFYSVLPLRSSSLC